jgi:hypothetical protein
VEYFGPKWKIYLEIQWQSRERFFEIYLEMTKNLEILSLEFKKGLETRNLEEGSRDFESRIKISRSRISNINLEIYFHRVVF